MGYKISRRAQDDIIDIYLQGLETFGVSQAEKYHIELEQKFELLAHSPRLARLRNEFDPPVHVHPYQSHIIVYIIDEEKDVFIIRVRAGAEDWLDDPVG